MNKYIYLGLVLSIAAHLGFLHFCNPVYKDESNPGIVLFPDLVVGADLTRAGSVVQFPQGVRLSAGVLPREYTDDIPSSVIRDVTRVIYPEPEDGDKLNKTVEFIYLWQRQNQETSGKDDQASYRAYVGPSGSAILLVPQKLVHNSVDGLLSQQYAREASLFFTDKYFWTKIETVVK